MSTERQTILNAVMRVLEDGEYLDRIIPGLLLNCADNADGGHIGNPALIRREVTGVVENAIFLDHLIDRESKTPVKKMKPVVRNILRMSVYEIYFMDSIGDHAAVNEAVKLTKKRGFSGLSGFVNGILRSVIRKKESQKNSDEIDALPAHIRYSVPDEIYDIWLGRYGEKEAGRLSAAQQKRPGITLRLCGTKEEQDETVKNLTEKGIKLKEIVLRDVLGADVKGYLAERTDGGVCKDGENIGNSRNTGNGRTVSGSPFGPSSLTELDEFIKGRFYIQDISSMAVAAAAAPKAGDTVIDVCAAPGGKSTHIADLLGGTGHVEARDLTQTKVDLIDENIGRLGLHNISAKVFDATVKDEGAHEAADIVIADLPCSGLGVLRKKPDIKYSFNQNTVNDLAKLQANILDTVCDYVKPGGKLVYSTCTMTREENEDNTDGFIARHPEFTEIGRRSILPDECECNDGFFISVFNKTT